MNLNGKEYNLPEQVNFGFIYKSNNILRRNGSSMMQLLATMEAGDVFTAVPLMGAVITGMNTNVFVTELDKHLENGGSYNEIINDVVMAYTDITTSAAFEGFMAAAMTIPDVVKAAAEKIQENQKNK